MENQNILRIVLSLAIVFAFFLPLHGTPVFGDHTTGASILLDTFSNLGKGISTAQLFTSICILIVGVCVLVNLVLSVTKKNTSVLFNLLPLIAIIALVIFTMLEAKENVGQALQIFGTGFYIMFLGSFLMPFTSIAVNPVNA